ncbi:MAG: SoxR reducing system RseC family protein [Oscillospiraceae bacterium]|nr:SoxR reducing system RseC family protein [Oscillospiraceae bacterium]
MMQRADVVRVLEDGIAEVTVRRGEECGVCAMSHMCGSGRAIVLKARNLVGARVGDAVCVKARGLFKAEIVAFVEPV